MSVTVDRWHILGPPKYNPRGPCRAGSSPTWKTHERVPRFAQRWSAAPRRPLQLPRACPNLGRCLPPNLVHAPRGGTPRTKGWYPSSKGLTSGYLPLGAVLAGQRVAEPFWRPGSVEIFRHGYTYSAHPTACAVGLANLDILEGEELVARARRLETTLAAALGPLAGHALVSEVRTGAGLLAAVQIAADARESDPGLGAWLAAAIRERGVITRLLCGDALQVSPPLVVTEAELGQIASVFAAALDAELP
jgi:Aminotransferase class-III